MLRTTNGQVSSDRHGMRFRTFRKVIWGLRGIKRGLPSKVVARRGAQGCVSIPAVGHIEDFRFFLK